MRASRIFIIKAKWAKLLEIMSCSQMHLIPVHWELFERKIYSFSIESNPDMRNFHVRGLLYIEQTIFSSSRYHKLSRPTSLALSSLPNCATGCVSQKAYLFFGWLLLTFDWPRRASWSSVLRTCSYTPQAVLRWQSIAISIMIRINTALISPYQAVKFDLLNGIPMRGEASFGF